MAERYASGSAEPILYRANAPPTPAYIAATAPTSLHEVLVRLRKPARDHPLGVAISGGDDGSPPVIIKVRGLAAASGLVQVGDLVLAVNNTRVSRALSPPAPRCLPLAASRRPCR